MSVTPGKKLKIFDKYNGRCAYCGVNLKKMTLDHIRPESKGGTFQLDNLNPACYECNHCKQDNNVKGFRKLIFLKQQSNYNALNKHWKVIINRFGFPVMFYFETELDKPPQLDKTVKFPILDKYVSMANIGWR
jgi:hypothetical protein